MNKVFGIILLSVGVVALGISMYIDEETGKGWSQIRRGEKQVEQIEKLSALNRNTAVAGQVVSSSGRQKIAKGRQDIAWYEGLSFLLKIGSGLFIAGGVIILVLAKKK